MLEEANRDIERLGRPALGRRRRQTRVDRLVRAIDSLLFELEDLNLRGVDRVPAPLRDRAERILEAVSAPDADELRVRFRVAPLMDVLFQAQETLFRLRASAQTRGGSAGPPAPGERGEREPRSGPPPATR
jgi:hypothetical protein